MLTSRLEEYKQVQNPFDLVGADVVDVTGGNIEVISRRLQLIKDILEKEKASVISEDNATIAGQYDQVLRKIAFFESILTDPFFSVITYKVVFELLSNPSKSLIAGYAYELQQQSDTNVFVGEYIVESALVKTAETWQPGLLNDYFDWLEEFIGSINPNEQDKTEKRLEQIQELKMALEKVLSQEAFEDETKDGQWHYYEYARVLFLIIVALGISYLLFTQSDNNPQGEVVVIEAAPTYTPTVSIEPTATYTPSLTPTENAMATENRLALHEQVAQENNFYRIEDLIITSNDVRVKQNTVYLEYRNGSFVETSMQPSEHVYLLASYLSQDGFLYFAVGSVSDGVFWLTSEDMTITTSTRSMYTSAYVRTEPSASSAKTLLPSDATVIEPFTQVGEELLAFNETQVTCLGSGHSINGAITWCLIQYGRNANGRALFGWVPVIQ
jgi:hypothetical protein